MADDGGRRADDRTGLKPGTGLSSVLRLLSLRFAQGELLILLSLALLPFLFFWRVFAPNPADRLAFAWGDFTQVFYPFRAFVSAELKAGRLPLWNPYIYSGQPALADSQLAVLYPLSWLTTLWSLGRLMTIGDLQVEAVLHLALTSGFTYLFARQVLVHRGSALIAALTFTYGGYLTGYPVLQLGILEANAWLPFILLNLEHGIRSRQERNREDRGSPILERAVLGGLLLAGLGLALTITVGHPQALAYVTILAGVYLLWRARSAGWRWRWVLGALALWAGVGLCLSAAQWLPTLEFLRLTPRAGASYDWASGGLVLRDLLEVLLPGLTTPWFALYIGIVPLLLAGLALTAWRVQPQVRFWMMVALVGLLISFGRHLFAYDLVYLVAPVLRLFRSQERAAFIFSFAAALLAGLGSDLLRDNGRRHEMDPDTTQIESGAGGAALRRARRAALGLALIGLALVVSAGAMWIAAGRPADHPVAAVMDRGVFIALLTVAALGVLALWENRRLSPATFTLLLAVLIGLDLFTVNSQKALESPPEGGDYPLIGAVAQVRADSAGPFRVSSEGLFPGDGNAGMVYRLEDVTGNSPLHQAAYDAFIERVSELRWWHLLNVKYILTRRTFPPGQFTLVHQGAEGNLYRLETAWPRAWIVSEAVQVQNDAEAYRLLSDPQFDPRQTAVLDTPLAGLVSSGAQVGAIWTSPGHLGMDVFAPGPSLLVISEMYTPGWRAFVDGRPVPILRADAVLQAIVLPAGARYVELVYLPMTFIVGAVISAVTLLGAAVVGWWSGRLRHASITRQKQKETTHAA